MSLPIAHALVGAALHVAFEPHLERSRRRQTWLLACVLPQIPDFDFAFVWFLGWPVGVWHRTFSHSVVFAVACGLSAALLARRFPWARSPVLGAFVGALVLSHALVDLFSHALNGPGRGVMLGWPFSTAFVASPWQPLPPGAKTGIADLAWTTGVEILLLGPPVLVFALFTRWRRRRANVAARG